MPTLNRTEIVKHSPQTMFSVVHDIASYAEFLPGCAKAEIISSKENMLIAKLHIQKGPIKLAFATHNTHHPHHLIEMRLHEGPFQHLHGKWQFNPLHHGGTQIVFDLDFELSNKLLTFTAGPILHQVAGMMVDAFIHRASVLTGTATPIDV